MGAVVVIVACPGRGAALFQRCAAEPGPSPAKPQGPRISDVPRRKGGALRRIRGMSAHFG